MLLCGAAFAQSLDCNLQGYKPQPGLAAELRGSTLDVTWDGEHGSQLRAAFSLQNGGPIVRELAVRKNQGGWIVLSRDLSPEYEVTTGRRRMSEQQLAPLRKLNVPITPALLEKEQWNAF